MYIKAACGARCLVVEYAPYNSGNQFEIEFKTNTDYAIIWRFESVSDRDEYLARLDKHQPKFLDPDTVDSVTTVIGY